LSKQIRPRDLRGLKLADAGFLGFAPSVGDNPGTMLCALLPSSAAKRRLRVARRFQRREQIIARSAFRSAEGEVFKFWIGYEYGDLSLAIQPRFVDIAILNSLVDPGEFFETIHRHVWLRVQPA